MIDNNHIEKYLLFFELKDVYHVILIPNNKFMKFIKWKRYKIVAIWEKNGVLPVQLDKLDKYFFEEWKPLFYEIKKWDFIEWTYSFTDSIFVFDNLIFEKPIIKDNEVPFVENFFYIPKDKMNQNFEIVEIS